MTRLRCGRCRHAEIGKLRDQELDRLRVRGFVHAVKRLPAAAGEKAGNGFVRDDHQFLDKHVRVRLALPASIRNTPMPVELEDDLPRLDPERPPGEPPPPELRCQCLRLA
jgi:hypothetical protein